MPAVTATAPGKIILLGEHAVVYGQPAIAMPVDQVMARTIVIADPLGESGTVSIEAPDINLNSQYDELPEQHPLRYTILLVCQEFGLHRLPASTIRISSSIPIESGMGSGAAITVSLVKALTTFLGLHISDEQVSGITFEVEKLYHKTPSGIDNTVITYKRPIYFRRDFPIDFLNVTHPIKIIIGDTGEPSPTSVAVSDLRDRWKLDSGYYEALFSDVGDLVITAKQCIENGNLQNLGELMTQNHTLLQRMGVSSEKLDKFVHEALEAGALGAKMSGGGMGGNMIALVTDDVAESVQEHLLRSGAVNLIQTVVEKS